MPDEHGPALRMAPQRVETIVDGVFAIAMTLLVLNLNLPPDNDPQNPLRIHELLVALWPQFKAYGLSFLLLGMFWFQHHRAFHFVAETDVRFVWLNITWLLFVSMVPFSTLLIDEYGHQETAALFFHGNMLVIGLFMAVTWRYAAARGLLRGTADERIVRFYKRRSLFFPGITLGALAWALVNPSYSSLPYLLLVLQGPLLRRLYV